MIELTSKQFHSLTGLQLIHLLGLDLCTKYRAVWVDDVRVWVWRKRQRDVGVVCVSPVIGPHVERRCGKEGERVGAFRKDKSVDVTHLYLERLGYRVEVRASGYTVMRGERVIEHVDDGRNVHARYALREIAVNRRLAWQKVREDYNDPK